MSGGIDKQARKRRPSSGGTNLSGLSTSTNAFGVIAMALLVFLGAVFIFYAVALGFTYVISQGEVRRAGSYHKKVKKLGLDEPDGTALGKKLDRTSFYFSGVFLVFVVEEIARYLLHTGTADLPVWIFRFVCLGVFTVITGVFLVRLRRWRSFKSTKTYEQTMRQISRLESTPGNVK